MTADPVPPLSPLGWLPHLWRTVLFPGAADARTAVRPLSLLLVLLLPAVLLYPTRSFYLLEPDEGRYAQIPKEMFDAGEWVVPTLQGEPYLDKPPLMYWLVMASYKAFGVNEAAARLVPALCVHLTILMVYLIGRRSLGERAAFWAAAVLTVSPGFLGVARLLLLDGLLTFCVTTSVLCGFEAVRSGKLKLGWWVASAIFSGLGFLTKGPISEVLLFPPLLAFAWLNGSAARVGWKRLLLFFGIVLGINLPWYIAVYLHQPEFLKHFFWEHNVMRFIRPFDHLQPVWYYVPILLGGFLPGVVLFVPYIRNLLLGTPDTAANRSAAGGFWLLSGLWCLFFFSCSGSKLPTYILPAFPPLCLALGEFIARSRWDKRLITRGIIAGFAAFIGFAHYVAVPWYAKERSPMGRPELVWKYLNDPTVAVVTYPREVSSVAFYTGRNDLTAVRSKDVNQLIRDSHHRPKTVILFTHNHSLHAFGETLRGAVNSTVGITETTDLSRTGGTWLQKLAGSGPWGLCDIAVIEPGVRQAEPIVTKAEPPALRLGMKPETEIVWADTQVESALMEGRTQDDKDNLFDSARAKYQTVLKADPNHKGALLGLARLYAKTGDRVGCVKTYTQAIDLDPKDHETAIKLAKAQAQFGDWVGACNSCERALALDPGNRQYLKTYAYCLANADKWVEAFAALRQQDTMSEADARYFLGRVFLDGNRLAEGRAQLELALKADPNHIDARVVLDEFTREKNMPGIIPAAVK